MKLSILHIEDYFCPTMGYQLNFLSKYQVRLGHEVTILTSNKLTPWSKKSFLPKNFNLHLEDIRFSKRYGVKIIRSKALFEYSGRTFLTNIRNILKGDYDFIHVHGFSTLTGLRIMWMLDSIESKVIFDSHMVESASLNRFKSLLNFYIKKFITPKLVREKIFIVAVAEACRKFLIKNYNIPKELIPVIPLGTDPETFYPDISIRNKKRKELGISENDVVFIYTGKFDETKDPIFLIKAFLELTYKYSNIKLILIGNGEKEYIEKIESIIVKKNDKFIREFPKTVYELNEFYNAADIAIWPKASSLSFFDAQAVGLPVILEDIDINVERLSYNNGVLFKKGDIESLKDRMEYMINLSPKERLAMGLLGRKIVEEKHSYKIIAKDFEELYYIILSNEQKVD